MLTAVPELADLAELTVEAIANVDSVAMTLPILSRLAHRVRAAASAVPPPRGIVVTHGTDTLEESAYWLHLVCGVELPIVLTAAMRPGTELGADGPVNLWNAVRTAVDPRSAQRGVLVAMNERIFGARDVLKLFAQGVDAFQSPGAGLLGRTDPDGVRFYRRTERRCGAASEFAGLIGDELPRVDVIAAYQEADGASCAAAVAAGARGLVLVGPLAPPLKAAAQTAAGRGVAIVVCHRGAGGTVHVDPADRAWGLCAADDLSPAKARILLRLALAHGVKAGDLPRIFAEY
jgi:L-asparaginase